MGYLEPSRTPINKLDSFSSLDGGNGWIHVLGYNVSAIEKADGHVFAFGRIALHHLEHVFKTLSSLKPVVNLIKHLMIVI